MAKLSTQEREALAMGFNARQLCRSNPQNPFTMRSHEWRAWELGDYLNCSGRPLADYERGRGGSFVNERGAAFKVTATTRGGFTGIAVQRLA